MENASLRVRWRKWSTFFKVYIIRVVLVLFLLSYLEFVFDRARHKYGFIGVYYTNRDDNVRKSGKFECAGAKKHWSGRVQELLDQLRKEEKNGQNQRQVDQLRASNGACRASKLIKWSLPSEVMTHRRQKKRLHLKGINVKTGWAYPRDSGPMSSYKQWRECTQKGVRPSSYSVTSISHFTLVAWSKGVSSRRSRRSTSNYIFSSSSRKKGPGSA